MRLYEYAAGLSSLGLLVFFVGFVVHRLIYSWGARRHKLRLWYTHVDSDQFDFLCRRYGA